MIRRKGGIDMLGLRRGTVKLYPHETSWEKEAARTISLLREILGGCASDIQHVGSTAIRTVMAKPIVDIAVAAESLDAVLAKRDALEAAGFYYRPQTDLGEQLLFACGSLYDGTGDEQTHFIHVVKKDGVQWRNYVDFRDYLNANDAAAREYEALKLRLAAECPIDEGRARYLAGKHDFIQHALRKATVWSYLGKKVHIEIDRPVGYVHKKDKYSLTYPINYGYIPGVLGGDGEELDVYLLGVDEPVREADCRVIGVVHRRNDCEDKLIAAPEGMDFTAQEMARAVRFQEQWYDTFIQTKRVFLFPVAGEFTVCKVKDYQKIDIEKPFVFTGATNRERSLVCPTRDAPVDAPSREDGWRMLRVGGQLDFSLVGILADLAGTLAKERIPLFALSTFDTDHLLIKNADYGRALGALRAAGYVIPE